MKVKRYVVNALPEALPMIRSELGADAVILNTKEIRVGGFLGLFGKKKTEVIAAAESNGADHAKPAARPAPAARASLTPEAAAAMAATLSAAAASREKPVAPAAGGQAAPAAAREPKPAGGGPAAVYAARTAQPAAGPSAAAERARSAEPAEPQSDAAGAADSVPHSRAVAPVAARIAAEPSAASMQPMKSRMTEEALMNEIRDMKQWIMRMSKQQQLAARPEALQALHDRLTAQEVGEPWSERLLEAVEAELAATDAAHSAIGGGSDRDAVWGIAERTLLAWLSGFEDGRIGSETRVVHFVGPTGVGKTTSIAKLAAEQTLKAGRKVGFITSDTYRIAAVDQLRTYATILNVPLEVVFSPAEVTRAFQALEDRELIFMDTAGRNFRNELYVSEVNSLLQPGSRSETFLVLSLTGKSSDMSAVAANFARFGVTRVLYTKQDETNAVGAVLNLALEHGLKPTYIAYGQTVPDDIAPFRASDYVRQLLGAPHE